MTPESEIRRRIAQRGPVTFAEFMAVALYHPEGGYYTSSEPVGAAGDFYTSPSIHPAFGTLLAVQLHQMWELMDRPAPFTVVEPGCGNGLLCRDILKAAEDLPGNFARSLRYVCVDRLETAGRERGLPGANRIASTTLPFRGLVGCILSNELIDAMPVHQVTLRDGVLKEVFVALDGDRLATRTGDPSTPLLQRRLGDLGIELEEGQIAEVNLSMDCWIREAAQSLHRGLILAIDYGRTAEELYSPTERFRGTLTTYHRHLQTDQPLERVGQQDMTAQVDFSALARASERAGLDFLGYTTQAEFLSNLGLQDLLRRPLAGPMRQVQANRVGIRELAKPGGLGGFKVIAFGKDVGEPSLWGFQRTEDALRITESLPQPVITPDHIDLTSGRYPATEVEFEMSWGDLWLDDEPNQATDGCEAGTG